MPEMELPTALWVLLGANLFFLLLVWIGQLRAGARLRRIEYRLSENTGHSGAEEASLGERKSENQEQKRQYQEFLAEDPSRKELAKKEQFAAFRKWRSEKGLNWGADGG
ncbi:hypothetical protein [Haloferula sp.]|uniref:hypothetical protein n=1 Tax=Haloferula sp. TaxID=2497595 RepID=UPI00329FC40D